MTQQKVDSGKNIKGWKEMEEVAMQYFISYLEFNGGHSSKSPRHWLSPEPQELLSRVSELRGHQAVEDEVGGAVD